MTDRSEQEIVIGCVVHFQKTEALHALQDDGCRLVGHFEYADDFGHSSYGI